MPDIEEIRKKIDGLITEKGLNYRDASLKIGRKDSYLHQYVKYGYPRRLKEIDRVRLAKILGINDSEIMDDDVMASKTKSDVVIGNDDFVSVSVIASKVSEENNLSNNVIGQYMITKSVVDDFGVDNVKNIKIVKIDDDTMKPTISSGDSVWFDCSYKYPESDGLYVLRAGRDLCVRRIQTSPVDAVIEISADNSQYKPYQTTDRKSVKVLGKVLFVFHKV